jgi:hypothetical protein
VAAYYFASIASSAELSIFLMTLGSLGAGLAASFYFLSISSKAELIAIFLITLGLGFSYSAS